MNPASDTDSPPAAEFAGSPADFDAPAPANWREALLTLISARVALIEMESKLAAKAGAHRAILIATLVLCVIFMWALLLAGTIALLAQSTGWPWYWIAIGTGGLHLLAAIRLAGAAKAPAAPAFPVTRAEFIKDREWIENFPPTRNSNG